MLLQAGMVAHSRPDPHLVFIDVVVFFSPGSLVSVYSPAEQYLLLAAVSPQAALIIVFARVQRLWLASCSPLCLMIRVWWLLSLLVCFWLLACPDEFPESRLYSLYRVRSFGLIRHRLCKQTPSCALRYASSCPSLQNGRSSCDSWSRRLLQHKQSRSGSRQCGLRLFLSLMPAGSASQGVLAENPARAFSSP